MQEIANDLSQSMLNGLQGRKNARPSGKFMIVLLRSASVNKLAAKI